MAVGSPAISGDTACLRRTSIRLTILADTAWVGVISMQSKISGGTGRQDVHDHL
jgi:hypothetical protein